MENSKTTMDTGLEDVLKDDIMQDIIVEAGGKAVKVYGKVAGLNCVGRTFFATEAEIADKNKWAQTQMMQKYGAEIYGASAQLQTQKANEAENDSLASSTGTGSA